MTECGSTSQLLASEQDLLGAVVQASPAAIYALDREGRVVLWNPAAERTFGWAVAEVMNRPLPVIGDRQREECDALWRRVLAGERVACLKLRWLRRDGSPIDIGLSAAPIRDAQGRVTAIMAMAADVTESKAAEERREEAEVALRRSEAKYRTLFDQSLDAIYLHDLDGRIIDTNRAAEIQSGYTCAELARLNVFDLLAGDAPRDGIKAQWASWSLGDRHVVEGAHRHKDGSRYPVEISTGRVRFEDQEVMLALTRDISARKRAQAEREGLQAQILQAQKMEAVGRLAGGVAHDFNNMLGVILGNAELALARIDSADLVGEELQAIREAALRSADLTRQLLAFARKQPISPRLLDLNETVSGTLKMLRRIMGEEIDVVWRPGAGVGVVRMDPSQIDQVLANLCVNARDAIDDVGTVTIETTHLWVDEIRCARHPGAVPGEHAVLSVADSGCGMGDEVLDRLFEPFFTTKEMGKGTGLGLATVRGIVEQNRGFIEVESQPGAGATFRIYLPAAAAIPRATPTPVAVAVRAPGQGHERILLVEDEERNRTAMARLLELLGYRVMTAGSPGEAMRLAQGLSQPVDLLVTDVIMPEMNGRQLARQLAVVFPSMKCLFVSGYAADIVSEHGVLDRGVHFLQKPFSREELAGKVKEVLGR
jgi:two-component system cell cycle sensor histidine kinase/response regulator CckA